MIAPSLTRQSNQPIPLAQAPTPQADHERKRKMKEAWKAYRGEFQPPLKVRAGKPDHNVIHNRCEPIVNKGVSFLFGPVLTIEATEEKAEDVMPPSPLPDGTMPEIPDKPEKPTPVQDFLDGLWGDDDDKMTFLSKLDINGGVCGQAFVKVIPAQAHMKFPRLVTLDPTLIRIVTDPDDCELHLAYIIEYPGSDDFQKKQVIARVDPDHTDAYAGEYDLDDNWTIRNYVRRGQSGNWQPVGAVEVWPYPFAPVLTCQNLPNPNEAWGMPDLTPDLIAENKMLNFLLSNIAKIIEIHGHPKTWARGVHATEIDIGVDELICLPAMDSTLQNLEMHSDLASSLHFIQVLLDNMDEQSRVPGVALGRLEALPRGTISGVSLKLLLQPLMEKTTQKQRLYGKLIREISRAALILNGLIDVEDYEDYPINLRWQNMLPIDDLFAAQTAQILVLLGVSKSTVLQELGYNPEDEAKKTQIESAQEQANAPQPPPAQQQPGQTAPVQAAPAQSPFIGGQ